MALSNSARNYATEFLAFVNASPTPFHAVQSAKDILRQNGFVELSEREDWSGIVRRGSSYFTTRNGSSLIAFRIGSKWEEAGRAGIGIVGTHTDSPCLRLKPNSKKSAEGYLSLGVETYGGGIWHTWFDRDLSLAGRVTVEKDGGLFETKLVKFDRPLLRIPTLAIHLDSSVNQKFEFNKETNFEPIFSLDSEQFAPDAELKKLEIVSNSDSICKRHHIGLLNLIKSELHLSSINQIREFELLLHDMQPASLGGLHDEFLFSPRLDNLGMTYAAIRGLAKASDIANEPGIRMISLFDHEEVGSLTAPGANSNFLPSVIKRLVSLDELASTSAFEHILAKSFLISADMAHAVHPNYAAKYEASHKPILNKGPVIKVNASAKYATNSLGAVLVEECARKANVPVQRFVVRNDSSSGSTIGPMLSAKLGITTLDLGNPQLSMHSIRETGGSLDVAHAIELFSTFFTEYSTLEPKIFDQSSERKQ